MDKKDKLIQLLLRQINAIWETDVVLIVELGEEIKALMEEIKTS